MLTWELHCPHCGGPNSVSAATHCCACTYCSAGLWVRLPDGQVSLFARCGVSRRKAIAAWDRQLKLMDRPLSRSDRDARLVFVPFWRVDGLMALREEVRTVTPVYDQGQMDGLSSSCDYTAEGFKEERHLGDWIVKPRTITVPAFNAVVPGLDSLGMRVETVTLGPWREPSVRAEVRRCRITVGQDAALNRFEVSACAVLADVRGGDMPEHILIAPQFACVYWPVWELHDVVDGTTRAVTIDGVNGRLLGESDRSPEWKYDATEFTGEAPELFPHRCPDCGKDLPVDPKQAVFCCRNCGSLTAHVAGGERITVKAAYADGQNLREHTWYPFWCFAGADQVMVPAFNIRNYRHLVRFGGIMSGQNRAFSPQDNTPRHVADVTLPVNVAAGLAGVICRRRNFSADTIRDGATPWLVYTPLHLVGAELVDPVTELCLRRSALTSA